MPDIMEKTLGTQGVNEQYFVQILAEVDIFR
jgi:hypothetical protein